MQNGKSAVVIRIMVFVVFASVALLTPYLATKGSASWSDDWFDQKVSNTGGYYEGQKRGYYSGGSFSGRWQTTNDHLFNVQLPHIKTGCSGIDAFMGGFGFLDFDFLVEKLQKILQGAAGYAFQIGLKVLAQEAASALEFIEGVADMLNAIQLDDCKASQAIVAYAAEKLPLSEKQSTAVADVVGNVKLTQGYETHYKKIQRGWEGMQRMFSGDDKAAIDEGKSTCPSDFANAFFKEGSILHNLGQTLGYPEEYVDLMSGILGDVYISTEAGFPQPIDMPPLNGITPLDQVLGTQIRARKSDGSEYIQTAVNGGLRDRVGTMMEKIATKMRTKGDLTAEERAFVDANPMNLQLVLKSAVGTNQEVAVITSLTDVTSKAYAYFMVTDLYTRINELLSKMDRIKNSTGGNDTCQTQIASVNISDFDNLKNKLKNLIAVTQRESQKSQQEAAVLYQIANHFKQFDDMAKKELKNRFGGAVTGRIMAGR